MRINPISTTTATPFKGVVATNKKIPEALFGAREKEFDALSDAKRLNVWTLETSRGGMANPQSGYLVLIQNSDGAVVKELKSDHQDDESKQDLTKKVQDCLIWINALGDNIMAATAIEKTPFAKENPKQAELLKKTLFATATSREARNWEEKIDLIV